MKNKTITGILAIFLGSWGAHYFYLGDNQKGVKYLLISLLTLGVGALVLSIIGLIEGIKFLMMTDEEFNVLVGQSGAEAQNLNSGSANASAQTPSTQKQGSADKYATLKQYKELLDAGAISQEEFDQLKKEILTNG